MTDERKPLPPSQGGPVSINGHNPNCEENETLLRGDDVCPTCKNERAKG